MGDLQDVHRGQLGVVLQEGVLGGRFEVAEQEQGQPRRAHEQGDAGVVGAALRLGRPTRERGPQHLPGQRAEASAFTGGGGDDRDARAPGLAPDERRLPGRFLERGALDRPDRPAAQHAGQPVHVVRVIVRQQQERYRPYAQRAQAPVHGPRLGAGVHDDGRAVARRERQGVALPHIAGREPPAGRRPAGDDPGQGSRPEDRRGDKEERAQRAEPPPSVAAVPTGVRVPVRVPVGVRVGVPAGMPVGVPVGGPVEVPVGMPAGVPEHQAGRAYAGRDGRHHQQRARQAVRPAQLRSGKGRSGPCDGGGPGSGPAGEPGEGVGRGKAERGDDECGEAEHRRGGDRELGEEVAGDGDQAHSGRQHDDHRCADRLGRGRRREGLGEPARHTAPAQGRAPARGERQEGAGGQDGEQESVTARQPGVVEDQDQHRGRQGGQQAATTACGEGEQGDQPADRGPEHARLGPAHHHEPQHEQSAHHRRRPQGDAQPACQAPAFGPCRQMGGSDQ